MKGIIINADDYGMALSINDAIEKLSKFGCITSTSIMPNMPHVEHITNLLNDVPDIGVGVHLNLSQGNPISLIHEVPSLVNEEGEFFTSSQLIKKIIKGAISFKQCKFELRQQIERARELTNNRIDHWDSHQGIHRLEPLMSIFLKICLEMGMSAMRSHKHYWISSNSQSRYLSGRRPGGGLKTKLIENYYLLQWWRSCRYFASPKGLIVLSDLDQINELTSIKSKRKDVFELVCHPATSTSGLMQTSVLIKRVNEYESLTKPENIDLLVKSKKSKLLMTFRDLKTKI